MDKNEEKKVVTEEQIIDKVKNTFVEKKKAMIVTALSLVASIGGYVGVKKLVKKIKEKIASRKGDEEPKSGKFPWNKKKDYNED